MAPSAKAPSFCPCRFALSAAHPRCAFAPSLGDTVRFDPHMQPAVQLLQAGWHDLVGWMLILAGTALAVHTLGPGRARRRAAHILRAYRPADWHQRHWTHRRMRPMHGDHQWLRLEAIAERGFAQAETAADLHARAAEELQAIDDALTGLLALHPRGAPSSRRPDAAPLAAPDPAPLAA